MKREIKFRFWDKELHKMGKEYELQCGDGGSWGNFNKDYIDEYYSERETSNSILMQFTGLKDINGNEVYEGDILETEWTKTMPYPQKSIPGQKATWKVIWFSGTFKINGGEYAGIGTGFWVEVIKAEEFGKSGDIEGIARKYDFYNYGGNGGVCTEKCKIIGNIYKNPELLK